MTAAELMDMVRLLARGEAMQGITDGALLQALNVAQDDVSRNLRAPTQTVTYTNVNGIGAFSWPSDARDEGIQRVYALTRDDDGNVLNSKRVPVYDFHTASVFEPSWTIAEPGPVARFIVFDPGNEVSSPYPVPPPDADNVQAYRVTYVVRPTKMTALDDQPFHGKLDSFHDALAYRAAWLLTRDTAMLMEYERRLKEARGATNRGALAPNNPLYTRNVTRGGRG